MLHYELIYILPNNLIEEQLSAIKGKVEGLIKTHGGEVIKKEDWGEKKLAYEIKKFKNGYYCYLEFKMEPTNLKKVNDQLILELEILRFQLIRVEEKTDRALAEEKIVKEKIAKRQLDEMTKTIAEEKEEAVKTEEAAKPKEKISAEELDEKIEELLEDEVIK